MMMDACMHSKYKNMLMQHSQEYADATLIPHSQENLYFIWKRTPAVLFQQVPGHLECDLQFKASHSVCTQCHRFRAFGKFDAAWRLNCL